MALDDGAAGRALRREAGSTYVASSSYQPVTLEITRVTLRTLWGVEFDDHLRSRHDVAAEGADADGARRKSRDGRGSSDSEPSVPRRSSLPDLETAARSVQTPGVSPQIPRTPQIPHTPADLSSPKTSSREELSSATLLKTPAKSPSRSFLKTLSKTIKRAIGVPSKKQKLLRAAAAAEARDEANDTKGSDVPKYKGDATDAESNDDANAKGASPVRREEGSFSRFAGGSDDGAVVRASVSSGSEASSAVVVDVSTSEDVVGELHSFASPKQTKAHRGGASVAALSPGATPSPGEGKPKMTRIGTMLDIRDARDAVDSPEQKREGELEKKQKKTAEPFAPFPQKSVFPKKDGGSGESKTAALRNAHSVMDIASLSRSEDHEASSRVEAGGKKEAALGVDAKNAAGSPSRTSESSQSSRTTSAPPYAPTAAAMGMSEEEFRKSLEVSSKKTSDAASDAASELKPRAPSPLDAYVFAKQLGVGLTGSVYKAWRRVPDGSVGSDPKSAPVRYVPVAVKVMDKVKILDINETAHVVQESKIMRSVSRHPFIVSMIESFQTESAMFIAMEYAAAKDLFHMIHEHGALRLSQCRAFVVQTVLALDHVHAKGFVYRDLKPENLLVREDGYLRLTDFGFAKALRPGERAYTVCGTPDYLAPETLRQQGCTRAADFWAVGVLLFEMLTGYPPFHGQTHSELYRRITSGRMRAFPRSFDEDAADLVNKLLRQSEGERIGVGADGIQRIRRHPFFKGFSWTAVLEQRAPMHKPAVARDPDRGPEDVKKPVTPECLARPCALTAEEQALFAEF
jgi:serine/threonine protein kinase